MPKLRRSRLTILAALFAVAALAVASSVVLAATSTVTITEANSKYSFGPATINVKLGDTVHWQNQSDAPHTADSDDGSTFEGEIAADTGSFDWTADKVGTFAYKCDIHDYMHGTVVVTEAGSTQPPTDTVAGSSGGTDSAPFALLLFLAAASLLGGLFALRRFTTVRNFRD